VSTVASWGYTIPLSTVLRKLSFLETEGFKRESRRTMEILMY
jgi:hypothetical protein